jgi:hypothetical protein
MKKFFLTIFVLCLLNINVYSQVIIGGGVTTHNAGEPTAPFFLNANTNYSSNRKDNSKLVGKGLYFPRVDLSSPGISFGADLGSYGTDPNFDDDPTNWYFTYLDGLVVYNTATSGKVNPAIGSTDGTLTQGFWYYDNKNPSGANNNAKLVSGTWRPLGSSSSNYVPMPSFNLPWSTTLHSSFSVDLFAVYRENLEKEGPHNESNATLDPTDGHATVVSNGSETEPLVHPFGAEITDATDLTYIITDYDMSVISNVQITEGGLLTYQTNVAGPPPPHAYVNIVVKKRNK